MWNDTDLRAGVRIAGQAAVMVFGLSLIAAVLESVAGVDGHTRVMDLTRVFLEWPFWLCVFGGWLFFTLRTCFKDESRESTLKTVMALAPLALLAPIVNMCAAWLGLESTVPTFVNVLEAPVTLLTLGWWPRLLATSGTLVTLSVVAILLGVRAWQQRRPAKHVVRIVAIWLGGSFGWLLLPSVIAWIVVSGDVSPLNAGPNVLARSWVALAQSGYWWSALVDRFPGILEGEALGSVRLLQLASAWLTIVCVGSVWIWRLGRSSWKKWLVWSKPVRGLSFLLFAVFGMAVGQHFGGTVLLRFVDVIALLMFFGVLKAAWLYTVTRNDLADAVEDTHAGRTDRPLVTNALSPTAIRALSIGLLVLILTGGWLLGWPVLLPILVFLGIQELLVYPGHRFKNRWLSVLLLSFSTLSAFVAGVFFSLRNAAVPLLNPGVWLAMLAFCLFQALPKAIRGNPVFWSACAERVRLPVRFLIPIGLACSYLLVPLLSGWTILWWMAIPCAVVALFPLLGGGRWDERKIVGWQVAFLLVSLLLLLVQR